MDTLSNALDEVIIALQNEQESMTLLEYTQLLQEKVREAQSTTTTSRFIITEKNVLDFISSLPHGKVIIIDNDVLWNGFKSKFHPYRIDFHAFVTRLREYAPGAPILVFGENMSSRLVHNWMTQGDAYVYVTTQAKNRVMDDFVTKDVQMHGVQRQYTFVAFDSKLTYLYDRLTVKPTLWLWNGFETHRLKQNGRSYFELDAICDSVLMQRSKRDLNP